MQKLSHAKIFYLGGNCMSCLFCKIVNGEIPASKIYEDEHCIAFLDIFPRAYGHALVITKEHYPTLDAIADAKLPPLLLAVKEVALLAKNRLGAQGYNLVSNNGEVSGQEVPHVHFHILPRFADSKIKFSFPPVLKDCKEQLAQIFRQYQQE